MLKPILRIVLIFVALTLLFALQKVLFMAVYADAAAPFTQVGNVVWHGLAMDSSMAGYLTVVPAVLTIAGLFSHSRGLRCAMAVYFALVSLLLAAICVADLGLYAYWGFRLDTTPLFYLASSPSAAMASVEWWQILLGLVGTVVLALMIFVLMAVVMRLTAQPPMSSGRRRRATVAVAIAMTLLLFIPIRGGVTVSTMNLSSAYFSSVSRLNHAAINPAFSLLYSATHQSDFGNQYVSFDSAEAERIFADGVIALPDTAASTLSSVERPDICLVILESFSSHLMLSMGGGQVAVKLDSIAGEGLLFTRFYASSFRTDRALPAILSGWPGQPSTSIMKFASKAEHLPSWPRRLVNDAGYKASYFYGGDINFTNMHAYLVSSGFSRIIRDTDFPIADRASKWGAHDHVLFERALAEMSADTTQCPRLTVIQTSSSHEPFDVPYRSAQPSKQANAFAYADSCLGVFVDALSRTDRWARTLLVIVPDHYGAWPDHLSDIAERHHVPLVISGGALARRAVTDSITASQTDIAATMLAAVGLSHDEFEFSNNLSGAPRRAQAFISEPSVVALVTDSATTVWQCDADSPEIESDTSGRLAQLKAWLQVLYSRMDSL